jgi:hypothetical protein
MLSCVRSPTGKITAAAALLLLLLPVCSSAALALCLIHGTAAVLRLLKDSTGGCFDRIAAQ